MAFQPAIQTMLNRYTCETKDDYKNALSEIIQEVTLLGLSRHGFFDKAAFYGGTALRIAHGIDRFSEDLDFELLRDVKKFQLEHYLTGIEDEFRTYGLRMSAVKKKKVRANSSVDSAFIKGNTIEHFLMIEGLKGPQSGINKNDQLKVKLEIDVNPPEVPSSTEIRYHSNPIPFAFRVLDLPSLYSGKLHAILCRSWGKGRVKGRDFYDFLWYRSRKIEPNYDYLKSKLVQSNRWSMDLKLGQRELYDLLLKRFAEVDWKQARRDVEPFIRDPFALQVWSLRYFESMLQGG